jgi:hypothetical protein
MASCLKLKLVKEEILLVPIDKQKSRAIMKFIAFVISSGLYALLESAFQNFHLDLIFRFQSKLSVFSLKVGFICFIGRAF